MLKPVLLGTALLTLWTGSAAAAANPAEGGRLARQWCAGCHMVRAGQSHAFDAPTFESIARRPSFDAKAVSYYLLAPHPPMPNLTLSRREANDLAAYIATQK